MILKVKYRSNQPKNLRNGFLDPQNPEKHVLHILFGQMVEKLKFIIVDGGHFEFEGQM